MIRVAALLATITLFCSLPGSQTGAGVVLYAASPASLVSLSTPYDLGEMPGAMPISLVLENRGNITDRLLGGSTPAAARVEIHTSQLNHGTRQMLTIAEGIILPAGETVVLEPARSHLMLVGLREDLVQGESFPLTLRFAHAGEVAVTVRVRRKVDAAGLTPIPPAIAGDLTISLASAPPAAAPELATPQAS